MTTAQIRALERWVREVTALVTLHPGIAGENQHGVSDACDAFLATLHPTKRATNGELPLGSDRIPRINLMFGRKASKPLSAAEEKLFHAGAELCPTEEFEAVEAYYHSKAPYCRRDVETLLRNWNGEVDRARAWAAGQTNGGISLAGKIKATQELLEAAKIKLRQHDQIIPAKILDPEGHSNAMEAREPLLQKMEILKARLRVLNEEAAR